MKHKNKYIFLFEFKDLDVFLNLLLSFAFTGMTSRSFLEQHEYITNKLACFIRDAMNFDCIIVTLVVVVAALGIQVISPFLCKTKGKATHSELQIFLSKMHASLSNAVIKENFFEF